MPSSPVLQLEDVSKSFVLHLRGGALLPVVDRVSLSVSAGECVVLAGPSGAGKSSILRMIYGNYRCERGRILVQHNGATVDVACAEPRVMIALRHSTVGYVSQFLRVIPRVPAIEIVAGAAEAQGLPAEAARERAGHLLERLNVPKRLWELPPATFSGGEQQRVNIARGFIAQYRILLLDEPTASLDAANREVAVALIAEQRQAGAAVLGIFHDEDVRDQVADRIVDVTRFAMSHADGAMHV